MSLKRFSPRLWAVCGLAVAWMVLPLTGWSEDEPKGEKAQPAAKEPADKEDKDAEKEEEPVDIFKVPADASSQELLKYIDKLMTNRPRFKTQEELFSHFKKLSKSVLEATEKILEDMELTDEETIHALGARLQAHDFNQQLAVEANNSKSLELAKKYVDNMSKKVAEFAKERLLLLRGENVGELKPAEQDELADEFVAYLKQPDLSFQKVAQFTMQFGRGLEQADAGELAAKVYEQAIEIMEKHHADAPQAKRVISSLQGTIRRMRLIGSEMELTGTTVDGKEFDFAAYQGKVVLVDFWATWCGPCIGELPNVVENYRNYHKKGFEIVGVSLDSSKEKLDKFIADRKIPWTNLFSTDEETSGWQNPLATKYGVNSIPFTVLIGRDGKVLRTNVRGPKLGEALQELLGEPDPLPEEKPADEDKAEKAEEKKAE